MHTSSLYNIILDGTLNMAALIPYFAWRSIYFNRPELIGSTCRTASSSHARKNTRIHIGYAGIITENEQMVNLIT
jgi:hypothetical protein